MNKSPHNRNFEVLTIEEYAKRLQVGRSTILNWKSRKTLIPGRHYFQVGKVLRFIWDLDLILEIHTPKTETGISKIDCNDKSLGPLTTKRTTHKKATINLDY